MTGRRISRVPRCADVLVLAVVVVLGVAAPALADTITVGSGTLGGADNASVTDPNLREVAGPANTDFTTRPPSTLPWRR